MSAFRRTARTVRLKPDTTYYGMVKSAGAVLFARAQEIHKSLNFFDALRWKTLNPLVEEGVGRSPR